MTENNNTQSLHTDSNESNAHTPFVYIDNSSLNNKKSLYSHSSYNPTSSFTNIGPKLNNTWRLCTLNTRGLNTPGKADNILQFLTTQQTDFLCLTETKLKNQNAKFLFPKSQTYHHIYSTNDSHPFGSGISILIKQTWAKHIQKTHSFSGRLIHITFAFSGNIFIHLIGCYFPAALLGNNKHLKQKMLRYINTIIFTTELTIILGDFNEHFFESP